MLLIKSLQTKFSEIFIEIHIFSFKKMYFNVWSAKYRQVCLGLKLLMKFCWEIVGEDAHLTLLFKMIHNGTSIFLNQFQAQFSNYEFNISLYARYNDANLHFRV